MLDREWQNSREKAGAQRKEPGLAGVT